MIYYEREMNTLLENLGKEEKGEKITLTLAQNLLYAEVLKQAYVNYNYNLSIFGDLPTQVEGFPQHKENLSDKFNNLCNIVAKKDENLIYQIRLDPGTLDVCDEGRVRDYLTAVFHKGTKSGKSNQFTETQVAQLKAFYNERDVNKVLKALVRLEVQRQNLIEDGGELAGKKANLLKEIIDKTAKAQQF